MTGDGRAMVYSVSHLCCLDFEANCSLPGQHWRSQENELVQPTLHARTAMLDEPRKATSPSECVLMHPEGGGGFRVWSGLLCIGSPEGSWGVGGQSP